MVTTEQTIGILVLLALCLYIVAAIKRDGNGKWKY